ncbi:hypothetical protein LTR08_004518 [Meristemomyces frigidus]|nr:hypothetical protein LTR08_004518 [Meristemomyces frigidus]
MHLKEKPELRESYQVAVVDYSNPQSLQYALRGIDTVISTVMGPNQIELIKAAVAVRVRRFAASEFEGLPDSQPDGPLDRGRSVARQWLTHYRQHLQTTTFVCGILYERFQPGGLQQSLIGLTSSLAREGDYIMNCRTMAAQVPYYDANNVPNVTICLTAAEDVGRFVAKAIDMPRWPEVLTMYGQRVAVRDLVQLVQQFRGRLFNPVQWHTLASLRSSLQLAVARGDADSQLQLHALIATAEGRYDFVQTENDSLNHRFPDVRPITFGDWFVAKWGRQT